MSDLVDRCKDIIAWHDTGLLPEGPFRAYADRVWGAAPDDQRLAVAETVTAKEAMKLLVEQARIG